MSLHTIGSDTHYILPASHDSIPEAFRSCKSAKPIPCSLQTVNVVSLSGNQTQGGSSIIQIPCGASAGIMMNSYVRFSVQFTGGTSIAAAGFSFKGAAQAATMCIQSVQTYVNSVQVDNLQNAWNIYDTLLTHSTSNDWLQHDGTLMLGTGVNYGIGTATSSPIYTFAIPLIGLLGSQQSLPLYLLNGTLQIQINWQPNVTAVYQSGAVPLLNGTTASIVADPLFTGMTISNVQCVYDKVTPEGAFVDKVRHDMMSGAKYVFSYTNYASTSVAVVSASQVNLNYGLNVSSLRGVVMSQYNSANLNAVFASYTGAGNNQFAGSISNGLTQFQVALDGRLISSLALNTVTDPVLAFAELQKSFGRIFDASITDPVVNVSTTASLTAGASSGGSYVSQFFAIGASAQRVNEGLSFEGSPASILNVMFNPSTTGSSAFINSTAYFLLIADFQLLIDSTGSVEIVR